MDRPRPVPPYLRVVDESAWVKGEKIDICFSGGDPDAGVGHGEAYDASVALFAFQLHLQHHLTMMSELYGVAHQVENDLAKPSRIALHQLRHFGCEVTEKFQTLFICPRGRRTSVFLLRSRAG